MNKHDLINGVVSGILVCTGLWVIFGRHPKIWRKRSRLFGRYLAPAIILYLLWMIFAVQTGALMFIWPAYSERELLGLTPDQVVSKLGKPTMDPRVLRWREDRDGPLFLNYDWNWTTTTIVFEHNRVVRVKQSPK